MQFTANNNNANKDFNVTITLSLDEISDSRRCNLNFAFGVSAVINNYLQKWADKKEEAKILSDYILETIKSSVYDYIDGGTFDDVATLRQEAELYSYMESVYYDYLTTSGKNEEDFLSLFQDFDTLKFDAGLEKGVITIFLVNSDKTRREILDTFPVEIVDDVKKLELITGFRYMVATILGDKLFGEDCNPIRDLENTPGFADGGLIELIHKL